jgi:hypothetical protein
MVGDWRDAAASTSGTTVIKRRTFCELLGAMRIELDSLDDAICHNGLLAVPFCASVHRTGKWVANDLSYLNSGP